MVEAKENSLQIQSTTMVEEQNIVGLDDGANDLYSVAHWVCRDSHEALCCGIGQEGGGAAIEIDGVQGCGGAGALAEEAKARYEKAKFKVRDMMPSMGSVYTFFSCMIPLKGLLKLV
ncbi:Hypothetical predicted protein [Olea europaea subsp. europaea]|uniref:Uncharacterized protein n=1 Tax=Olea europaea subsp. europaea TaxID=158383 RepID=A0A8S0VIQ6_OLEEU|nr:Hypothetical predicted protein [Olea europaea subsp. europaea]